MFRVILIILGSFSLILGIIGIVTPVLPTTPFVILSAGLFVRSSPALYHKLVNHSLTGKYIIDESGKINLKTRLYAIIIMWLMILITIVISVSDLKIKIILVSVGVLGTTFKLWYRTGINNKKLKH